MQNKILSLACFVLGFASIIASIIIWFTASGGRDPASTQRLSLFVGLWPPTFFILSQRFAPKRAASDPLVRN